MACPGIESHDAPILAYRIGEIGFEVVSLGDGNSNIVVIDIWRRVEGELQGYSGC